VTCFTKNENVFYRTIPLSLGIGQYYNGKSLRI
jgi:hypothetical protein